MAITAADATYPKTLVRLGLDDCTPVGTINRSGGTAGGNGGTDADKGWSGGGLITKTASSGTLPALCHCSKPARQTSTSLAFETRAKIAVRSAKENGPTVLSSTV